MRSRRVVVKRRFPMVIIPVLLLAGVLLLWLLLPRTSHIRYGTVSSPLSGDAIIVRDETAVPLSGYEKIVYHASEGELLTKGGAILSAYKTGYPSNNLASLIQLQRNIVVYQNETTLQDFDKPELTQMDFDIDVTIKQMQAGGDDASFTALHKKLLQLLKARQEYIRSNFTPDGVLQQYYDDEDKLLTQMESWMDEYTAQQDTYISYYTDGLEQSYQPSKLADLKTSDILNDIKLLKKNITQEKTVTLQYKTVNPGKWYIVLPTKNTAYRDKTGQSYEIFLNNSTQPVIGQLYKVIEDYQDLLIFEVSDGLGQYLSQRTVFASVGKRVTGFMVPLSYIEQGENAVLHVDANGKNETVTVQILDQNEQWAVVEPVSGTLAIDQKIYNK